jgi:hypothetical protein
MDLNGRTALVTGASSGIGAACAKQLSAAGARVILCGRDSRRLEAVAQHIPTPVASLTFDVRDPDALRLGIESLGDEWDHVDVLVSNAGVAIGSRPFADSDPEDWTEMVQVNLLGTLHVIQTVLPGMLRRASGHVVTIGSIVIRVDDLQRQVAFWSAALDYVPGWLEFWNTLCQGSNDVILAAGFLLPDLKLTAEKLNVLFQDGHFVCQVGVRTRHVSVRLCHVRIQKHIASCPGFFTSKGAAFYALSYSINRHTKKPCCILDRYAERLCHVAVLMGHGMSGQQPKSS